MINAKVRIDILKEALKNLKRKYYLNILVIFVASIIINGGYNFVTQGRSLSDTKPGKIVNTVETLEEEKSSANDDQMTNAEILIDVINTILDQNGVQNPFDVDTKSEKYYSGVLSVFVNEITGSQSFIFGILNGLNHLLFKGNVSNSIIIFIFAVLSLLFFLFVKNVITTGKNRYYLEQRRYHGTRAKELLFPYKNKRLKNISWVMFCKYIFEGLWWLTIVGGFIKSYEYVLIPYIITENPEIKRKDAFLISKQLMKGEKWNVFLLDLTMIPLPILSYLTYNLTGLFFSDAYIECVRAELYMRIRDAKKDTLELRLRELLNDDMLDIDHIEETEHPSGIEVLDIPTVSIKSTKFDYMRNYSFLSIVQLFYTYSLVGWIWEVIYYAMSTGAIVNRGTLHGPWLPIYGCGGILIIWLLRPFREKPALLFLTTVVVCGVLEYTTSWLLEVLFNEKWWDYTGYFMNINGRVCLEGLLVFGMAGLAFTYLLSPLIDDLYERIPKKARIIGCIVVSVIFVADVIFSILSPNMGEGVTSGLV